jgi:hypothetical protein
LRQIVGFPPASSWHARLVVHPGVDALPALACALAAAPTGVAVGRVAKNPAMAVSPIAAIAANAVAGTRRFAGAGGTGIAAGVAASAGAGLGAASGPGVAASTSAAVVLGGVVVVAVGVGVGSGAGAAASAAAGVVVEGAVGLAFAVVFVVSAAVCAASSRLTGSVSLSHGSSLFPLEITPRPPGTGPTAAAETGSS